MPKRQRNQLKKKGRGKSANHPYHPDQVKQGPQTFEKLVQRTSQPPGFGENVFNIRDVLKYEGSLPQEGDQGKPSSKKQKP